MTSFNDVIASCNEAAAKVDYSNNDWKPDDGQYTVQFSGGKNGISKKGKAWYRATFSILDGPLSGKNFSDSFFFEQSEDDPSIGLANFMKFGSCLAGRELKTATEALTTIESSLKEGTLVSLDVFTSVSKGKTYRNVRYREAIRS